MNLITEYDEKNKNKTVLKEISDPWGTQYVFLLDESKNEISFASKGNPIRNFKDFLKRNPFMTSIAVTAGIGALDKYRSTKRNTTRLFAQTQIEKTLYADMAKELANTGKYIIMKNGKRIKDGWLWELKRKGGI